MFENLIGIFLVLMEFNEGLIVRKIYFWVEFGFNWKKLKFGGYIAIS
jgi:hypothetical protein